MYNERENATLNLAEQTCCAGQSTQYRRSQFLMSLPSFHSQPALAGPPPDSSRNETETSPVRSRIPRGSLLFTASNSALMLRVLPATCSGCTHGRTHRRRRTHDLLPKLSRMSGVQLTGDRSFREKFHAYSHPSSSVRPASVSTCHCASPSQSHPGGFNLSSAVWLSGSRGSQCAISPSESENCGRSPGSREDA